MPRIGVAATIGLVIAGNLIMAPLSAVLAVAWVHRSRTPWRDVGYVRPGSWIGDAVVGIVGHLPAKDAGPEVCEKERIVRIEAEGEEMRSHPAQYLRSADA